MFVNFYYEFIFLHLVGRNKHDKAGKTWVKKDNTNKKLMKMENGKIWQYNDNDNDNDKKMYCPIWF